MVKKSILVIACILSVTLFALIVVSNVAHAETANWARILKDDVYLYKTEDGDQPLFILEKSYYVHVIQDLDSILQVEVIPSDSAFLPIVGYVYRNEVSLSTTPPTEPYYPAVKVTVTADSVELKLSPVPSSSAAVAVLNMQSMFYYGKRESYGLTWYYVRYAGKFGYVEASAVSQPNITLHPTPLPQTPASTTPTPPTDPPEDINPIDHSSPTSEILLIVFVVILAVGLMLALFLPGNVKKKSNIFEQDI